jgi:hypothetical protein
MAGWGLMMTGGDLLASRVDQASQARGCPDSHHDQQQRRKRKRSQEVAAALEPNRAVHASRCPVSGSNIAQRPVMTLAAWPINTRTIADLRRAASPPIDARCAGCGRSCRCRFRMFLGRQETLVAGKLPR